MVVKSHLGCALPASVPDLDERETSFYRRVDGFGGDCLGNTDSGTGLKQARLSFWAFNPSALRGRMARLGLANRVDPGGQAGLAVRAAGSRSYRSVMLRSCEIMEHMPPARITRRELFRAPTAAVPAPVDGSVTAPDTPGLGVELVMETIAG